MIAKESTRDFNKMKLNDLKELCHEYGLPLGNKDDMIRDIKLYDTDKYIYPMTQEKYNNGYLVGVAINDKDRLIELGKMTLLKEARPIGRYNDNRINFYSVRKLV